MINLDLNTVILLVLCAYFFISIYKRFSYKITFVMSVIMLMVAAAFFIGENEEMADIMATIAYFLLITTVALVIEAWWYSLRKTNKV